MKKLIIFLFTFSCFVTPANANPYAALDVFEEYALTEADLLCEDLELSAVKNTKTNSKLPFTKTKDPVTIEIVTQPKNGKLTLKDINGNFIYTPEKNFTGTDTFQFRISTGTQNSNIANCLITINETGTGLQKELDFSYIDMKGHWANDAVSDLVRLDIIKGERVGKDYFFYPDTKMRRIDVIFYILSALNVDSTDKKYSDTHIFADSKTCPEYINRAAFLANELGFLEGTKNGEFTLLNPYEYITRGEMICMIDLATGKKEKAIKKLTFNDNDTIPQWALESVKNLKSIGFISGYEDNNLRPFNNVTKAECAQFILKMIEYNEKNASKAISKRIKNAFYGNINV